MESLARSFGRSWRRQECARILHSVDKRPDRAAPTAGSKFVATAHTRDDQVETLLLKMMRGVHLSNMQPVSVLLLSTCCRAPDVCAAQMKAADGEYVRPLIHLSKEQLRSYMVARGLEWREDSSNQQRHYRRNKVRLDVVPALQEVAGGSEALHTRLSELSEQSALLKDWISRDVSTFVFSDK